MSWNSKIARNKENILTSSLFKNHPSLNGNEIVFFHDRYPDLTIEGGDVVVFDHKTVMIGLSETTEEILECIDDLNNVGCEIVTVGQYLQPSKDFINVSKYYTLKEFDEIKKYCEEKENIITAECGPMVISSYHAEKQLENAKESLKKRVIS